MEIRETREFPKEIKDLIINLRRELVKHDFVFGALFIAKMNNDVEDSADQVLVMADETPQDIRLPMLIDMQETVAHAILYYSTKENPSVQ